MPPRIVRFLTLAAYREARGRRQFHRWNAVTRGCATDEQHQRWMVEQAEEIQREESYRRRVGTTERMGRVLGLDGSEIPQPVRTASPVSPPTPEPPPVQPPQPAVLVDYSGCTPLSDIFAMLPITTGSE